MEEKLREKRNKIYYMLWEKLRGEFSMKQIAEILNISLPSFYRILKIEFKRETLKNAPKRNKI